MSQRPESLLAAQIMPLPYMTAALSDMALRLAEDGKVALAQWAPTGELLLASPAYEELLRLHGGDLPGAALAVARVARAGLALTRPMTLALGTETRHFWCRYIPIMNVSGDVIAIAGAFQDWTAELTRVGDAVRDQARFRDFARASSDWFWETDAEDRITALSDRITAVVDKPAADYIGQALQALGVLENNLTGDKPFERARADRQPFRNQLLRVITAQGESLLFHLSGVPLFDATGQFRGYRGAGMDVTRAYRMERDAQSTRRNLETALIELQSKNAALDVATVQAQSALTAKNEFLAAMSHELRTPLNAIIGFAEAMEMQVFGGLDNHYVGYAKDIRSAGRHLLGLIEDILDVSVIESGEISLSLEPVSLGILVDQARSLVAIRAQSKTLDLADVSAPADTILMADERRTLQIFVNLLTNAVKFTPEGGRIGVDVAPPRAGMQAITFWDTGRGIDPRDHERVFEKFQQCVGDTYTGKPEGTGLGLHISRELARLMGGDLTVSSALGEGSRFTVVLPVA
jgi:PAS domain S-box-containing protein